MGRSGNQPSISITPLHRQGGGNTSSAMSHASPQQKAGAQGGNKTSFVICEICDGYIKVTFENEISN